MNNIYKFLSHIVVNGVTTYLCVIIYLRDKLCFFVPLNILRFFNFSPSNNIFHLLLVSEFCSSVLVSRDFQ